MRFAVFHLIMALWVLWRFVLPLDLPRLFKAALALLVVVTASFSTVTVFFFGGLLSPEAPRWFLIAGNSGEAVLLFLCGLTAVREVLILLSVLAGRSGEKMHYVVQKDRRTALGIAAAAAGLAAAGVSEGVRPRFVVIPPKLRICLRRSKASSSSSFPTFMPRRFLRSLGAGPLWSV